MHLHHGRTMLALHELQPGSGPGLLLLHALHGRAKDWGQGIAWAGPVYALDFSGHGDSESVRGGAYSCELLAADADCALAHCGAAALAGTGLGAYVALLLSGTRSRQVRGTLLLPGRGLAGGADAPRFEALPPLLDNDTPRAPGGPDPLLSILEHDVRPGAYAAAFATRAHALLLSEDGTERPPWWQAVRATAASVVVRGGVDEGLAELARIVYEAPIASAR